MIKNYGLKVDDTDENAYVLGGTELPKVTLQPDKNWRPFLPIYEPQFGGDWDSYGCVIWGTQNICETILKRLTGKEFNFSERFNYILADISPPGTDPHAGIQSICENGMIADTLLPMTKTYAEFLTPKPMTDDLLEEGLKLGWEIGHQYLWKWTDKLTEEERTKRIREHLQYSPLGVSVTAWILENGVYVDNGQPNTHWCMLFGEAENGWLAFDSYDQEIKILSFSHNIQMCKRFYLTPSTILQQVSILKKIVLKLQELLTLLKARISGIMK